VAEIMVDSLRVTIVEDEYRIAVLINKLIHWEELHLQLAGIYANGREALDAIIQTPPDVLITDIKMPEMDGIELIRNIRERGIGLQIILISGFREFEYAHSALRYGVNDYLIKPVKETELNETLKKLYNEETKQRNGAGKLENEIRLSRPALHREALHALETGKFTGSLEDFNTAYALRFRESVLRVFMVKLDPFAYSASDEGWYGMILEKIADSIHRLYGDIVREKIVGVKEEMLSVTALCDFDRSQKIIFENTTRELLSRLKEYLYSFNRNGKDEITIGMGNESGFENIKTSFRAADACIKARIFSGAGKIIQDNDCPLQESRITVPEYLGSYRARLENSIQSFQEAQFSGLIDEIFKSLLDTGGASAGLVYECAVELIRLVFASGPKTPENEEKKEKVSGLVLHCGNVTALVQMLTEQLSFFLRSNKELMENRTGKPIREAMTYINGHYAEKITLEDIAELLQLNPTYFSVLFKKETGRNFSACLTEVRMEKAKEMLRTTNFTMERIAENAGYADTRHFSRIFTRIIGMKPSLYRKLYS
jgi:two-component system response regulator YesN